MNLTKMRNYDFDPDVQEFFDTFSGIKPTNWKSWLDLSSKEEFEELALKNSGLPSINDVKKKILVEKSSPKMLSIDFDQYIIKNQGPNPLILCHSSGTTNSNFDALKWFHMSKEIVERQWAPGMQAIFESSGLNSKSSVVIFVPSRMSFDGIQSTEESRFVSLYSSEFSQRVMLSIIKPRSYLLHQYKDSKSLTILAQILSMDDISAISAPAVTILGWANLEKLKEGIKRSLNLIQGIPINNPILKKLLAIIKKEGLTSASKIIQKTVSEKLSKAILVFSISSLTEKDWLLIRRFMNWEKGKERFTNLYVISEIGPFAASITKKDFELSRANRLYVFPLTLPVIEHDGRRELITRTKMRIGNLLVSRLHNSKALINIDLGDVVTLVDHRSLPLIEGKIRRSCFRLNYPVKLAKNILTTTNYSIFAGDYFPLKDFRIIDPRKLINCLKSQLDLMNDSILLLNDNTNRWVLYIANFNHFKDKNEIYNILLQCSEETGLNEAIEKKKIKIETIKEIPISFTAPRSEILTKVRNGKLPKGILKKWPLYLLKFDG
jgi:hypothetical protein